MKIDMTYVNEKLLSLDPNDLISVGDAYRIIQYAIARGTMHGKKSS